MKWVPADRLKGMSKTKRIVADIPEHIHRKLRVHCMAEGILVRDYILALLAKEGIR